MTRSEILPPEWRGRTCVVMAGGKSTRFEVEGVRHKSMALLDGKPLLHYIVEYWRRHTDDFVFVVKNGKETVQEFARSLPIRSRFVEPDALKGIADGLTYARREAGERFIMVLGDCFIRGALSFPPAFEAGIAVLPTRDRAMLRRNYAVHLAGDRVARLEEKPPEPDTDLCGLGFYFLPGGVFGCIERTAPSRRTGEVEITDVLQTLADEGVPLSPLFLDGDYVNVTFKEDLHTVHELLGLGR